jgi:hypothetical protein
MFAGDSIDSADEVNVPSGDAQWISDPLMQLQQSDQ